MKAKHTSEHTSVEVHLKEEKQHSHAKRRCTGLEVGDKPAEQKTLIQGKFPLQPTGSSSKWVSDDHPKQQLITDKIARMICTDMQPYSIVEDSGFREVIKAAEPRYILPSRKTFSTQIIPQLYSKTMELVKSDVNDAVSLAITTDGWTSRSNNSYLSYTAHFLTEDFKPRNYCLGVENCDDSHSAVNLATSLSQCISTWTTEAQKERKMKLFVVSDNAANIQAAVSKVSQLTLCKPLSCFAHTLQLVVNGAVNNCPDLQTTVSKAKSITTSFKHSVQSTQKLLAVEKQMGFPQLKLKQHCPTRWNSMYDMLERCVMLKDAVTVVTASSKKMSTLTASEWEIAEACVSILQPFKVATAALSAFKYPSLSMVIPTLNQLKHNLQLKSETSSCLQILIEQLLNNIEARWPNYEYNVTYAIATSVDPRYKDCGFEDPGAIAQARSMILKEMTERAEQSYRSNVTQLSSVRNVDLEATGRTGFRGIIISFTVYFLSV